MGPDTRISVLVVDDHAFVRFGLTSLLRTDPGLRICGEASTGTEAVNLYRSMRPDVVLMDLRLPDISGSEATRTIRKEFPDAKIIIISSFAPEDEVYAAATAGARSYVLKTIEPEDLIDVIYKVASGERFLPGDLAQRMAHRGVWSGM